MNKITKLIITSVFLLMTLVLAYAGTIIDTAKAAEGTIVCSSDDRCGPNGFTGSPYCQEGNAYQNYTTYTCKNPGTTDSYCANLTVAQVKETCSASQTCDSGRCIANPTINCSADSQCGTNGYTGSPYCQEGNKVYQNYTTNTCMNPGTTSSFCQNFSVSRVQKTCGTNQTCDGGRCIDQVINCTTNSQCGITGFTGSPYCQEGNKVYQNYTTNTCMNPGTASSFCQNLSVAQVKETCTGSQTCDGGKCINQTINCTTNSQCGATGYTSSPYCQGDKVYQNYTTNTCMNPGTASSFCQNFTVAQVKQTCSTSQICSNGSCVHHQDFTCTTNSDCGTNGYIGGLFCQGNSVYKNYKTYTCLNPSTINSSCTNSTTARLQITCSSNQACSGGICSNQNITCNTGSDCGTNGYTGSPYCQNGAVYQNYKTYTCNNAGATNASCSNSTVAQIKEICGDSEICSSGSCVPQNITCSTNANCGTNGLIGSPFCQNGSVYQNYKTYTCNNAGTGNSFCSNSTTAQIRVVCGDSETCSNGSCTPTNNCTSNYQQRCSGNNLYWYDSCGNQQSLIQYCSNGCSNNACTNNSCTYHSYQSCQGNALYWYDSCGNRQDYIGYCSNSNCTSNYQQRCSGNNLYWYDSCGNQQGLAQYCSNGCYNNSCYQHYPTCVSRSYKGCQGNNIYWYDSCGNRQNLYYNCANNQTCQNGQCVTNSTPYVAHYTTACYNNSLYWYDSLGGISALYRSCKDSNSCSADTCSSGKCSNAVKCNGSTCAIGSADYNRYCLPATPNHCGNGACEANLGETITNCSSDCKIINSVSNLSVSFFAKQDSASDQWQKTAQIGSNGQIYFMISAVNNSTTSIDNVNISANIPSEISSLGNLKVNGVPFSGDIVSGINIGSIAPTSAKLITFEGRTQMISGASIKQAIATSSISGTAQSDFVSIDFNPSQAIASVSNTPATSGFVGFLKRWYMWILGGLTLTSLFAIVFKRLSSEG